MAIGGISLPPGIPQQPQQVPTEEDVKRQQELERLRAQQQEEQQRAQREAQRQHDTVECRNDILDGRGEKSKACDRLVNGLQENYGGK